MAYYDMVGYFRGYSTDQYSRGKYVMKSGNRQRGLEVIFSPTRSDVWGYRVQFLNEYKSDSSKYVGIGQDQPEIFISKVNLKQNYSRDVEILSEQPIASFCTNTRTIQCPDCRNQVTGVDHVWTCCNKKCGFKYTSDSLNAVLKNSQERYGSSINNDINYMCNNDSESSTQWKSLRGLKYHEQLNQWY